MTTPARIQLSRAKGFNLQAASMALNGLPAVKVDRTTKFGNPFIAGKDGNSEYCVTLFACLLAIGPALNKGPHPQEQLAMRKTILDALPSIRGQNLACWCKAGARCHANVLLELANKIECDEVQP